MAAWIKSTADYWGSMLQNWPHYGMSGAESEPKDKSRTQQSFEAVFQSWQTLSSVAGDPGAMEAFSNLGRAMPEILSQLVQGSWRSYFDLQQQWMEKAVRIGDSTQAFSFENLDKDIFKAWTDIYEKEFRQFLYIPQLGLTRFYQEKLNEALDKHTSFQTRFLEFIHLVYLPVEKSFQVLQQQLSELAGEGKLPENSNDYYKMFIKILEGHYMSLFKSPEYVTAMSSTLDALEDCVAARNAIIQDYLKSMSVPTQDELDELYKEIYLMKKRLKTLEKANPPTRNAAPLNV